MVKQEATEIDNQIWAGVDTYDGGQGEMPHKKKKGADETVERRNFAGHTGKIFGELA